MMSPADLHVRTRTLARVAGPYYLVMAGVLGLRHADMALLFPAVMRDGGLVLIAGAFTTIVGLVMIAAHHHYTTPAAIFLSLMGWGAALKGAMLMLAPTAGAGMTAAFVGSAPLMLAAAAALFVLGAWLTFVGWLARTPQ